MAKSKSKKTEKAKYIKYRNDWTIWEREKWPMINQMV